TAERYERAIRYVETLIRTRAPRLGNGRFPGAAPAAWGLLEAGGSITGRDGLTLGEGDVQRYAQEDAELSDADEEIHVYNYGGEIVTDSYGDGILLPLAWTGGFWILAPLGPLRVELPGGTYDDGDPVVVTLFGPDHLAGSATITAYNRTGITLDASEGTVGYVAWSDMECEYQVIQEVCSSGDYYY